MEKLLFDALLAAVQGAFPNAAIFTEKIRQGFSPPCFQLLLEKCQVKREMGNRYRAEAEFLLRYYPPEEDVLAGTGILQAAEAALRGTPGFRGMQSEVAASGEVSMRLSYSAIGFWNGEAQAVMKKMQAQIVLGGK